MSDVGERSSPRFPSSAATDKATSKGSKSVEPRRDQPDNASDNQQLFYSDVGGYIPAAGIGIANQEFQKSYPISSFRSRQVRSSHAEPGSSVAVAPVSGSPETLERALSHTYVAHPNQFSTQTLTKKSIMAMSILHNTTKHERKVSIQIKTCQKKEERKKEKYKRANSLELHHELKGWRHSVGSRIPRTHSGPRASLTL